LIPSRVAAQYFTLREKSNLQSESQVSGQKYPSSAHNKEKEIKRNDDNNNNKENPNGKEYSSFGNGNWLMELERTFPFYVI